MTVGTDIPHGLGWDMPAQVATNAENAQVLLKNGNGIIPTWLERAFIPGMVNVMLDRQANALAKPTIALPTSATYYVDSVGGSASGNGLTPPAAFRDLSLLTGKEFTPGTTIYLAADAVFDFVISWSDYIGNTFFKWDSFNGMRGTAAAPIVIRPYYPRRNTRFFKPTIRYAANIKTTDWVQEPSIGPNIWSLAVNGQAGVDGSGVFVMFNESDEVGVNKINTPGSSIPYGDDPRHLNGPNQFSFVVNPTWDKPANKIYVWSGTVPGSNAPINPTTYYKKVMVGGRPLFRSGWRGFTHTHFRMLRFEYCHAVESKSQASGSGQQVVGLKILGCSIRKGGALDFGNWNTISGGNESEWEVAWCDFEDIPTTGVRNRPSQGSPNNTIQWRMHHNRGLRGNLSIAHKAWFYNQATGSTFFRAWNNYGIDFRNGTGGNLLDGSMLYADVGSKNVEFLGNVGERCGIVLQQNACGDVSMVSNIAIDSLKLIVMTASNEMAPTEMGHVQAHNVWLWTGRVDPNTIPIGPQLARIDAPILIFSMQEVSTDAHKFTQLWIANPALIDLSGLWLTKPAIRYTRQSTIANGIVVGGVAVSGFADASVVSHDRWLGDPLTDESRKKHVVSVTGGSEAWFVDANNGNTSLAENSPLRSAGIPINPAFQDLSGKLFDRAFPDIGALAFSSA